MPTKLNQLEFILKSRGLLRVGDLMGLGFPRSYLSELEKRGVAVRQARGVYMHSDADVPQDFGQSLACKRIPAGVICLLSALAHHQIGTQNPHEVWMAVDRKARLPKVDYPPLRIVRFSGPALYEGVQVLADPAPLRVYGAAKTVADCFKYRHKFGVEIAVEALREGWRESKFTMDELGHYARICRVENVMRPYLEAVL